MSASIATKVKVRETSESKEKWKERERVMKRGKEEKRMKGRGMDGEKEQATGRREVRQTDKQSDRQEVSERNTAKFYHH